MLLQAAHRASQQFLMSPSHCSRRPLPGEPPRLRRAHPDLCNKSSGAKLTFVRIPDSQRCLHYPADLQKRAAAGAEGASSDMPESMSDVLSRNPTGEAPHPGPTVHPSHVGPRCSEIRTARCQSSVPRGRRIPGQAAISGPPRWNFQLKHAWGDILGQYRMAIQREPGFNVYLYINWSNTAKMAIQHCDTANSMLVYRITV